MLQLTNPQETFKFIAFLEEGLNFVDAWTPTEINSGGCGEFALLFSDELDKYGIKHTIYGVSVAEKPQPDVYNHFVIQIEHLFFDSNGLVQNGILHGGATIVELTKEKLQEFVDNKGYWNPVYDHACDSFVKEKLDYIFDHYATFKAGDFVYPKRNEVKFTKYTMDTKRSRMAEMEGMPNFPDFMRMMLASQNNNK